MTAAIGAWISLPGSPVASTIGMSASAAVSAVIRMGTSRSRLPWTTASWSGSRSSSQELAVVRDHHDAVARGDAEQRDEADERGDAEDRRRRARPRRRRRPAPAAGSPSRARRRARDRNAMKSSTAMPTSAEDREPEDGAAGGGFALELAAELDVVAGAACFTLACERGLHLLGGAAQIAPGDVGGHDDAALHVLAVDQVRAQWSCRCARPTRARRSARRRTSTGVDARSSRSRAVGVGQLRRRRRRRARPPTTWRPACRRTPSRRSARARPGVVPNAASSVGLRPNRRAAGSPSAARPRCRRGPGWSSCAASLCLARLRS